MKFAMKKPATIGLLLGPVAFLLVWYLLPDAYGTTPFGNQGKLSAAIAVWMAIWWLSEAVPIAATALLPLAAFPVLGVSSIQETAAPYANDVIFLFLGGFVLSIAMQRWNLHKRIALFTLRLFGVAPRRMVLGFMVVTAVLSMWVSNTATAVMMMPIALSVLVMLKASENRSLELALLLGIAYAASIGGVGTIIGTPPNVFLVSYLETSQGIQVSFVEWMLVGIPFVALMLPLTWLLLTRVLFKVSSAPIPGAKDVMQAEYEGLGRMTRAELSVMAVFFGTALLWIFRPLLGVEGLSDSGIAVASALVLFALPADKDRRIMDWESMMQVPWGILLLFGGGLSLARAIEVNKVGEFLGYQATLLADIPLIVLIIIITASVVFLTELTSNTATTATLLPVLSGVALGASIDPMMLLVPTAIAASCAFMMPVATPPNAVVFGSGRVSIQEMSKAGVYLNFLAIATIVLVVYLLVPRVLS